MVSLKTTILMNVFERGAILRDSNAVIRAWVSFRENVRALLDCYATLHSIGQEHPPKIIEEGDTFMVIECMRGHEHDNPCSSVMLTISAHASEREIHGRVERWLRSLPGVLRINDRAKNLRFSIGDHERISLIFKDEELTAKEAAEKLIEDLVSERP